MSITAPVSNRYRMPAEWEPHSATWISWPTHEPDWPGKLQTVELVYVEIVRAISRSEKLNIICRDEDIVQRSKALLNSHHISSDNCSYHCLKTDRSWLRDSGPTGVKNSQGEPAWIVWSFNAWAKYDNYLNDRRVPELVASVSLRELIIPSVGQKNSPVVLEGGAIEVDGAGTILVTEECLMSEVQQRNPGFTKKDYENLFAQYLSGFRTIWLEGGCVGDDTHGHIDDIARFVAPGRVLLAFEDNPADENCEISKQNFKVLENSVDAGGKPIQIVKLPFPRPIYFEGDRLPASYANFYISNKVVLVPTFNDPMDRVALNVIAKEFPEREVVGIYCGDLVLGLGTLHCLTQQQPL